MVSPPPPTAVTKRPKSSDQPPLRPATRPLLYGFFSSFAATLLYSLTVASLWLYSTITSVLLWLYAIPLNTYKWYLGKKCYWPYAVIFLYSHCSNYYTVLSQLKVPFQYTMLYTVQRKCSLSTFQCSLYTVKCSLYTVKCFMCTVKCSLSTAKCSLSTVKHSLYTVKCSLSTATLQWPRKMGGVPHLAWGCSFL